MRKSAREGRPFGAVVIVVAALLAAGACGGTAGGESEPPDAGSPQSPGALSPGEREGQAVLEYVQGNHDEPWAGRIQSITMTPQRSAQVFTDLGYGDESLSAATAICSAVSSYLIDRRGDIEGVEVFASDGGILVSRFDPVTQSCSPG